MPSAHERRLRRSTPVELRPAMPNPVPLAEGRFDPDSIKSTLVGTPRRSLWVVTLDKEATGDTYDTWIMRVPQGYEARGEGDQREFHRVSDGAFLHEDSLLEPTNHPLLKPLNAQSSHSEYLADVHHNFAVASSVFALGRHFTSEPELAYFKEDPLVAELPLEKRLVSDQHAFPGKGAGRELFVSLTDDVEGDGDYVDTLSFTQEVLVDNGFSDPLANAAMRAIDLINDGTDVRFFEASHYRTRAEIEKAAGEHAAQALIDQGFLEAHPKWIRALTVQPLDDGVISFISTDPKDHRSHPQAPYRIDVRRLHEVFYPERY